MQSDEKRMRLRYAGVCRVCAVDLPARTEAVYERTTKSIRCLSHEAVAPKDAVVDRMDDINEVVDIGTPGASARRQFEQRQGRREQRIRTEHPRLGRLMLALGDEPQSTRAWRTGAAGEEALGRRLNELGSARLRVLHDRRIPGSRANIDHIAVTPSGVFVIDAKQYKGRPSLRVEGGVLRPRIERLVVAGRDRTKVVDGVLNQVEVVRAVVGEELPVTGVLCFIEADWPLVGGAFVTRGVHVLWPKRLYTRIAVDGPLDGELIATVHGRLAAALPPA